MNKLRVLLVGAAFSADLHSDGYSRIPDKVQIVGICDKDASRIEALAARYGAEIEYDPVSAAPYFYYTDGEGNAHVVWFEDVRSIQAKLDLNASYPLAGVSYWNIMREFPQNWNLLNQMVKVKNLVGK